jgi:LEA14-like dessication related protein
MSVRRALALSLVAGSLGGCATTKPPSMRVQALDFGKVGVTGVSVDVAFMLRNVNPEPLRIDRFEYDLELNGHRLGRGYYGEPIQIDGFKEERVVSRFDINFLSVPGTVRAVLDKDKARARAKGKFYVQQGGSQKTLKFDSDAEVRLRH